MVYKRIEHGRQHNGCKHIIYRMLFEEHCGSAYQQSDYGYDGLHCNVMSAESFGLVYCDNHNKSIIYMETWQNIG